MWERIPQRDTGNDSISYVSHRLKVPSGWIVRTIVSRHDAGADVSQIFVPDADHEWQLEQSS